MLKCRWCLLADQHHGPQEPLCQEEMCTRSPFVKIKPSSLTSPNPADKPVCRHLQRSGMLSESCTASSSCGSVSPSHDPAELSSSIMGTAILLGEASPALRTARRCCPCSWRGQLPRALLAFTNFGAQGTSARQWEDRRWHFPPQEEVVYLQVYEPAQI